MEGAPVESQAEIVEMGLIVSHFHQHNSDFVLVPSKGKNINKQRARTSGNLAISQTSSSNPNLIDSICEVGRMPLTYFNTITGNINSQIRILFK